MKYLIASLFLIAFVSTGFSKPIDDADLPPIKPIGALNSMVYGLAKQTLIQLQDRLKLAGHVEGVEKIESFIKNSEKMVDETADVEEKFDLNNHIDNVYTLIEEYENYLPELPDTKIPLVVPTTKELLEYLFKQLGELIVKATKEGQTKTAKLLKYYKDLLTKIIKNKGNLLKKEQIEQLISKIIKTIRRFSGVVGDEPYEIVESLPDTKIPLVVPTTKELLEYLSKQLGKLIVKATKEGQTKTAKLLKYYKDLLTKIIKNKGNLLKKEQIEQLISKIIKTIRRFSGVVGDEPYEIVESLSDSETIINLLDSLIEDMETIEAGLKKDNLFREAEKIRLNKLMFKKIRMNTTTENANRYSVKYALSKGAKLTYQYSKYLKKDTSYLLTNQIFGDDDDIFLPIKF